MSNLTLSQRLELYKFFATVGFSAGVSLFCMIMLAFHPGDRRGTNDSAYFGLLGGSVTLWLNPPGSGKKENNFAVDSQQTTIVAGKEQGE